MRTKFLTLLTSVAIVFMLTATGYARNCDRETAGAEHIDSPLVRIVENAIVKSKAPEVATLDSEPTSVTKPDVVKTAIPDTGLVIDKTELSVEFESTLEENVLLLTNLAPTSVSKWLERRANEETAGKKHANHSHKESEFLQDEGIEVVGGGWCNNCGCWMRHGCDTNGNCNISHASVCGSGYCSLHPFSSCFNSN